VKNEREENELCVTFYLFLKRKTKDDMQQ